MAGSSTYPLTAAVPENSFYYAILLNVPWVVLTSVPVLHVCAGTLQTPTVSNMMQQPQ
jgi:hypothetical protein